MKESDIEIAGGEINVKEIMRKLRQNIKKRRKKEVVVGLECIERKGTRIPQKQPQQLSQSISLLNTLWDIENKNYQISSHRKIIGPLLVKGRELVHGEVKRYVDPIVFKQKEFNAWTVRFLNEISKKIRTQARELPVEMDYEKFQQQFRGSEEEIKRRQQKYVKYFQSKNDVLDIGCGRGEFLELLRENGVQARGVEIDEKTVDYCKKKKLEVVLSDGIEYLESLPDDSLGGIFMAQVIEHLPPARVNKLIQLSYKKLKKNSYLVIETPNPLSLVSFHNFFLDPTHVFPLHPQLMEFLMSSAGFKKIEIIFSSPNPEQSKLRKLKLKKGLGSWEKEFVKTYNDNIEKLNSVIYGYQDYAIVGKK